MKNSRSSSFPYQMRERLASLMQSLSLSLALLDISILFASEWERNLKKSVWGNKWNPSFTSLSLSVHFIRLFWRTFKRWIGHPFYVVYNIHSFISLHFPHTLAELPSIVMLLFMLLLSRGGRKKSDFSAEEEFVFYTLHVCCSTGCSTECMLSGTLNGTFNCNLSISHAHKMRIL
jgi:amino acid transporter